jgi:hypothetical protein
LKLVLCLIGALVFSLTINVSRITAAKGPPAETADQPSTEIRSPQTEITSGTTADSAKPRVPMPQGPAGVFDPQGVTLPSQSSIDSILGMDPTIALFVGFSVLLVIVVTVVAASRRGHRGA